jgi:hypothetical protein
MPLDRREKICVVRRHGLLADKYRLRTLQKEIDRERRELARHCNESIRRD